MRRSLQLLHLSFALVLCGCASIGAGAVFGGVVGVALDGHLVGRTHHAVADSGSRIRVDLAAPSDVWLLRAEQRDTLVVRAASSLRGSVQRQSGDTLWMVVAQVTVDGKPLEFSGVALPRTIVPRGARISVAQERTLTVRPTTVVRGAFIGAFIAVAAALIFGIGLQY